MTRATFVLQCNHAQLSQPSSETLAITGQPSDSKHLNNLVDTLPVSRLDNNMAIVDDSLLDRIRADLDFAQLQTNSAYNDGYIDGLERAIEILENYDD